MPSTLRIGRLQADCRVAGPPETVAGVGDRATRALHDHLPHALRGGLARWLDRDDESVWIVKRLDLAVVAPADAPPDALASAVAGSLGRALADALTGDGDGAGAIRFARPAAYRARFVLDVARGEAWSRWYYAPFAGWEVLSPSATIRAALTQDPEQGRAALEALDDRGLGQVVEALATIDERRILDTFSRLVSEPALTEDALSKAAFTGCARAIEASLSRGEALFAFVRSEAPPSKALLKAVHAVLAAAPAPGGPVARLAAMRARAAGPTTISVPSPGALPSPAGSAGPLTTRFGGLGLLLRDLDAQPWPAWTAGWPLPPEGGAEACLRWLTLGLCAGRAHVGTVLDDPAWRTLLGIPVGLQLSAVGRWLRGVGHRRRRELERDVPIPGRSDAAWLRLPRRLGIGSGWGDVLSRVAFAVLRSFARRLPGFADSSTDHLWRNFLAFDATIDLEPERVVVSCGRPPLHLVLTLTGLTRGLVTGIDAAGRPILVFWRS